MWKNRFIIVLLAVSLGLLGAAVATVSTKDPRSFLAEFFKKLARVDRIKNPKLKESEFITLVSNNIDLDWVANFILGRHRKNISDSQRKQFIDLYSKYLASSYRSALDIFKDEKYEFLAVEKQEEHIFSISTIVSFNDRKIKTNFRVIEKDGVHSITDLIVEGISFISAKRADLNSMVMSKGFDGFLDELRSINDHNQRNMH
jgi:phospholipid transport system substrate-binding protein